MSFLNLPLASRKIAGLISLASALMVAHLSAQKGGDAPDKEIFEAIGIMFAQGSRLNLMDFSDAEVESIVEGIRKGIQMKKMPDNIPNLQPRIQKIMRAKMDAARKTEAAKSGNAAGINKAKAQKFFASLEKQAGIKKDPSGFYYEVLKTGSGANPSMDDTVRLHYHGTLIDGTVFDSSKERGQPASFPMRGVIKGFSGGLTKTKVGGKVRIYIPSELGYGDNPRPGGKIKPGDALIFECELLEIIKK